MFRYATCQYKEGATNYVFFPILRFERSHSSLCSCLSMSIHVYPCLSVPLSFANSHTKGRARPSIRVYMIRHAESMNNEVYRNARHLFQGGTPNFNLKGWQEYVTKHRTADPSISSKGRLQAQRLKDYLVEHLQNQASRPVQVITSPMSRTIQTILPTLQQLARDDKDKVDVVVNAMYFESEGCHLKGVPQQGMNQHQITDMLQTHTDNQNPPPSQTQIELNTPSFVGFDQNPDLGWYNYGTGPETRSESEDRAAAFYTWLCEYLDQQLMTKQQQQQQQQQQVDHDDQKNDCESNINANENQHHKNNHHHDIYDAGVSLPEEAHELDHDKLSARHRKRRTAILVGHGDFMSLCLKRIISGFGHAVENFGVPHRIAFTHFNTGITELEYFGKGMQCVSLSH